MTDPRSYYVSVRSGSRSGLLRGPFPTRDDALALVETVRAWCIARDPSATFHEFGTAALTPRPGRTAPPGRLNDAMTPRVGS